MNYSTVLALKSDWTRYSRGTLKSVDIHFGLGPNSELGEIPSDSTPNTHNLYSI